MHRRGAALVLGLVPLLIIGCSTGEQAPTASVSASPPPPHPVAGAPGAGDPYYPNDGNGGYDARDYHVKVSYDPPTRHLDGDSTMTAVAANDLSRFNLDLRGLTVTSVEVDDLPAKVTREPEFELVVTPAKPITAGRTFTVRVRYGGTPPPPQRGVLGANGWGYSASGGAYAIGEPHSAAFWYPVNETPRDKASFRVTARVPTGWSVVSNGREEGTSAAGGWVTSTWREPTPIASYLTTIAIDKFRFDRSTLPDGTPVINAYAPGAEARRVNGSRVGEVIGFLASKFGPYPQSAAGGIYLDEKIGFSLETQSRPTYAQWADLSTIVHENAHQWFGDSVSVRSWADVCLNECFASYAQWMWDEASEHQDLDDRYRRAVTRFRAEPGFWAMKLVDMGSGHEFRGVYSKGVLAIHALRRKVGEEAFGRILRGWTEHHRHSTASWADFEQFAGKTSNIDLGGFFAAWFHGTTVPADADLHPGTLRN